MLYSENNTFEKIMDRMLSRDELIGVDKRVGSIAYDSLAPCAMELAEAYVMIDILQEQTYLMTATGDNLDKRVYDYGVSRRQATKAQRIGSFKKYLKDENGNYVLDPETHEKILTEMDIPEGARFAVPSETIDTTYKYIGVIDDHKILECEQYGTKGNAYSGQILPLTAIGDLAEARIVSTYISAEDEETDDSLRNRTKDYLNYMAYGGNIADYIEKVNAIDGVGQTKVFPAWQQNGSVLLSVVDGSFDPITNEFKNYLKNLIDPEENSGQGAGIAPIGHYVTITTPVRQNVKVSLTIETVVDADVGEVGDDVRRIINQYFLEIRQSFAQNVKLAIYRARIIDRIFDELSSVILNITDVLLNDVDADIVYTDEGQIGMQYLPYLSEVEIN